MPDAVPSKERIRAAAARLFAERGYARTSVREVAAAAQVDPALVIRHFGSKELLFLETMDLDVDQSPLVDIPLDRFGVGFVELLLASDGATRGVFLAFVRGSAEPAIAERLRATHEQLFVAPLRARLAGPEVEARARLAAALVGGLLYAMWVVGDETLLAADRADVVRRYGGLLQELLTPSR